MKIGVKLALWAMSFGVFSGCGLQRTGTVLAEVPNITGPVISAGDIPSGQGKVVTLSNGAHIYVQNRKGILVHLVEGTFAPDAFSQIKASVSFKSQEEQQLILTQEIQEVLSVLSSAGGVEIEESPLLGYFSFEIPYEPNVLKKVKDLSFHSQIVLTPVIYDTSVMQSFPVMETSLDPRATTTHFSGLERIHVPEFLKAAEESIGGEEKVNGSSVKVGIADSGITLNHPNFLSSDGQSTRVIYMRDFTREGRVYFSKQAQFEVTIPNGGGPDDLVLNAQVISTPKLPELPAGDQFSEIRDLKIKVSPELKSILTQPGSGARLGVLKEDVFQSLRYGPVDLNGNGKIDDQFFLILVPGLNPAQDVIYMDTTGTADFRYSQPIGDWNRTKGTIEIFSEKIGFDFRTEKLPSAYYDEPVLKRRFKSIEVRSVSIVGFDPGNHGTHVSGIVAGRRTIENDSPNTLARGVAPEAKLMVNRVCANNGGCSSTAAVIDLVSRGAELVNLSLGRLDSFNDGYSVQDIMINRLSSVYNVLFIVSAGNSGPGRQTVGSPSTARYSLSVGASVTPNMIRRQYQYPGGASSSEGNDDFLLFFSSRGPTAAGGFKPNLTAPGAELSSIGLNSAPGRPGGLDTYWGTSMAAPTVAGAYALLLDAIKKFNTKNPSRPLTTYALTLRDVLIQSARPFDVKRFDPLTGQKSDGQYTWIDQGMGMLDLAAAWKKLLEIRDRPVPSPVLLDGKPIELDYQIVTSMKNPSGKHYDGSRPSSLGVATFGAGVYLNYFDLDQNIQIGISRKLPERWAASEQSGKLMAQLRTTADRFALKTWIYGSDQEWIRAGTLDQSDCFSSESALLTVPGDGAVVRTTERGTGRVQFSAYGSLNLCVNSQVVQALPPGDHGALVMGYRMVDGKLSSVASFIVPVYLTIPHQTLSGPQVYQLDGMIESFEVQRKYIRVPEGVSVVRLSLEVPEYQGTCSGVELMPLVGDNLSYPFRSRGEAQVSNCDERGKPSKFKEGRRLSKTITHPRSGIWDIAVFGSYRFPQSQYSLKIEYVQSEVNPHEISGDLMGLSGTLKYISHESSLNLVPSEKESAYHLLGLTSTITEEVLNRSHVFVRSPRGLFRFYPPEVKGVALSTGRSRGNDIDLIVLECPLDASDPSDWRCTLLKASQGSTDEEEVQFNPKQDRTYVMRVDGTDVKNRGQFESTETLFLESERGELKIADRTPEFDISYSFREEAIGQSKILSHPYFKSGNYSLFGRVMILAEDETLLKEVPIEITLPQVEKPPN